MSFAQYDVVVVGAGCAGLTAAIGLARAGFTVAIVEAASMPGGANGVGGVCFAENLAQPDILGPDGVEALAWERRLIERGSFATDGRRLTGTTYRDPDAFRHCYTVLRPIFDHHLAQIALLHGVALLTGTTVESLIRDGRRIVGVATTRGPLYGDLVFLAEGDAGHLVSREGFDRSSDPRDAPEFLYCLQQVIDLLPGAIEECFGVGPEQGVAHDLLLRNRGRVRLNVRGFVCTNRQSLTLSVVLPAEHLRQHFNGEPRDLLDWFADMPALRRWWSDGRRGAWTAKLLRAGGPRDIPYLIEDGLAIGGAAAGLSVDFPVMNSTGPATVTGLLLSRAATRIRAESGDFRRDQLHRHYLEPLQKTRYWKDNEFLQRWQGYVRRTRVLFDHELDLLLDSAAVWTRPHRWLPRKLLDWFRVLGGVRWSQWSAWQIDFLELRQVLRLREVMPRPALARVLLDGALNAFRDLARQPRPHLPSPGMLRVHYHSADEDGRASATPAMLRRWFGRFRPVLASAGHILYRNDDRTLSVKLTRIVELLVRQINLLDLLTVAGLGALTLLASTALGAAGYLLRCLRPRRPDALAGDTKVAESATPAREDGARSISRSSPSGAGPSIHIVSKSTQPRQRAEAVRRLPCICPTGVFEVRGALPETVDVIVHPENCIYCEACWRTNPSVDWARGGVPRLHSPVLSPVVTRLLEAEDRAGLVRPAIPRQVDPWRNWARASPPPADADARIRVLRLLDRLDHKLHEFDRALEKWPVVVDRGRSDHLEMLARYAQQLALRVLEVCPEGVRTDGGSVQQIRELAAALGRGTEERTRRAWDGRFSWAVADGRQLRQHHLTGLRRSLGSDPLHQPATPAASPSPALPAGWIAPSLHLRVEDAAVIHLLADIASRRYLLETLDPIAAPSEPPARAELLAALASEVRARLPSLTAELHVLLGDRKKSAVEYARPANEVYGRHGALLLADAERTRALLDVGGDWATLAQRRALLAERKEIQEAEDRLAALASDWRARSWKQTPAAEVSAGFARQGAHVLAGKLLLLHTHARLEEGLDAQLALLLLRVWLDYAATELDAFAILVQDRLLPPILTSDRPLVEPGAVPPPRTLAEYLAAAAPYTSGDFLLASIDLFQPRLVPDMLGGEDEVAIEGAAAELSTDPAGKQPPFSATNEVVAQFLHILADIREGPPDNPRREEALYLAEALALEIIGRLAHSQTRSLSLELAGARLILADLQQRGGALRERCVILQTLADELVPRWLRGSGEAAARHLGREVLELEALRVDFRRRLMAAWQVFGESLGRNADVQASCFALAEATAWLKAADSTLGRMAWLSRTSQAEDSEEPAARLDLGRRMLVHCHAEVRDRLQRFDEDLASLRRGYYAPHVRAAALLLQPETERDAPVPVSQIERPLRVLVIAEPRPAELSHSLESGEGVLESCWTLGDADRSALEFALRLREAAPDHVRIDVAAFGPPRVGQALREVLSLGIERVYLMVQDCEDVTAERAAAALAAALEPAGPFDLILGGHVSSHRQKGVAALVAGSLGVLLAGHATDLTVRATPSKTSVQLRSATSGPRERPLPAAVLIEAGTALRPFTIAGYLAGLYRTVEIVPE